MKKRKCLKILQNRNGSILQVVLVIFLILLTTIMTYGVMMKNACALYRYEKMMDQERVVEVLFRHYCRKTEDQDLLLSGTIHGEAGDIRYTMDDMGSYFIINADISIKETHYRAYMEMNTEDLKIRSFKYLD
ncbi:MAG: hypothetical protein PUF83_03065 [Intestinibaculum porci]|uniref:hypothetical protein n=1 Tax=Intestinibaculum porci TaxID=2487118 RepID=UPI0024090054|nr:hypothetical protein [Intestinibaculum porci]MDD6422026.1 hypothetical protein [Intestinibaculum porci]